MKLFVTGAGGFVGAAIAREAVRNRHTVVGSVRPGSSTDRLSSDIQGLRLVSLDLRDKDAVKATMDEHRPDVIIHAAWSGVSNKARNDRSQITENIDAACSLLDAGARFGVSKFVGIGSQGEYGLLNGKITEDALPVPTTLYGVSKIAVMHLTRQLAADAGMSFAWLRLFSTYGPGDNPHWLIPFLIREMMNDRRPKLTLGKQLWDYLFIDDVARGILAVSTTSDASGIFNLGSGTPISVRSLTERIRDIVAPAMDLVFGEIDYRADQIWHMEADIKRLMALTGWSPLVDIEQGLHTTIEWHRGQPQVDTARKPDILDARRD